MQIARNIELIQYKLFDKNLILFELINSVENESASNKSEKVVHSSTNKKRHDKTVSENLEQAEGEIKEIFDSLQNYLITLGDDVQEKILKFYIAYKRIKNFASVQIYPKQDPKIYIYLKLNPDEHALEEGFTRDVRNVGHYGTGDLEITIRTSADLERAHPLIQKSYENS
jgi:predicted transport protein